MEMLALGESNCQVPKGSYGEFPHFPSGFIADLFNSFSQTLNL